MSNSLSHTTINKGMGKQTKHYLLYCVYYTNDENTFSLYCIPSYRYHQDY